MDGGSVFLGYLTEGKSFPLLHLRMYFHIIKKKMEWEWESTSVRGHCVVPENIHTPPTEGFSSLTPHPPGFSVPEGLAVLPPTPRKFHDFATWPPTPWKIHFYKKKKRDSGHLYLFYHHLSKVSKCAVQVDKNVIRGTVFTETLS